MFFTFCLFYFHSVFQVRNQLNYERLAVRFNVFRGKVKTNRFSALSNVRVNMLRFLNRVYKKNDNICLLNFQTPFSHTHCLYDQDVNCVLTFFEFRLSNQALRIMSRLEQTLTSTRLVFRCAILRTDCSFQMHKAEETTNQHSCLQSLNFVLKLGQWRRRVLMKMRFFYF